MAKTGKQAGIQQPQRGVQKKRAQTASRGAVPCPSGAVAAIPAALLVALACSQVSELVGRKVDVPNAVWKGHDDGGIYSGVILEVPMT